MVNNTPSFPPEEFLEDKNPQLKQTKLLIARNSIKTAPYDLKELNLDNAAVMVSRSAEISESEAFSVLVEYSQRQKISANDALCIISILLQQGGTARSCDGNMTINFKGKDYKLAGLRAVLKDHSLARAERKLGRTLGSAIYTVCEKLGLPGNLDKKIKENNPEQLITASQSSWLSDFQSDNTDCPIELRKLITKSFNTQQLAQTKTQKKTGK